MILAILDSAGAVLARRDVPDPWPQDPEPPDGPPPEPPVPVRPDALASPEEWARWQLETLAWMLARRAVEARVMGG